MKSVSPITLSDSEKWLILALRLRWKNGEVVVLMRDGVPQRIKRAWESEVMGDVPQDLPKP